MGCGMAFLTYLKNRKILPKERCRILDLGTSCLVGATRETCLDILEYFLGPAAHKVDQDKLNKVIAGSVIQAGIRTTYLYELLELIPQIEYLAFDLAPNERTIGFDLNGQFLERHMRGAWDVLLNFGTTEHVVNQFHSFKTIHDLLKPGGIAFNQVPSIGYSDHGYFTYEPKFFQHLAEANGYEIIDMWLTPTGGMAFPAIEIRDYGKESAGLVARSNNADKPVAWCFSDPSSWATAPSDTPAILKWYVLNAAYRKTRTAPFRLGLDTQLVRADLDQAVVAGRY